LVSAGTLMNPVALNDFLNAATKSLTTDQDFRITDLAVVAKQLKDIGLDQVRFITVPIEAYPADPNRLQISASASALWQRIKKDQSLGPRFSGEAVKASDGAKGPKKSSTEKAKKRAEMAAQNGLCT